MRTTTRGIRLLARGPGCGEGDGDEDGYGRNQVMGNVHCRTGKEFLVREGRLFHSGCVPFLCRTPIFVWALPCGVLTVPFSSGSMVFIKKGVSTVFTCRPARRARDETVCCAGQKATPEPPEPGERINTHAILYRCKGPSPCAYVVSDTELQDGC